MLDRPDIRGRKAILDVHIKGKPLDKNVDLMKVAKISPGFSGADLANVVNEAAILAARRNKKTINHTEFEEALEKVALGPERRSRVISEKEKRVIAYHEGGHALVGHLLPNCDPIHKISIVARGMAGGVTWSLPEEDKYLRSKKEFEDDIAMALGGWAAEQLATGDTTTGASNDIEKASNMARQMVMRYGMSERLGPLAFGRRDELIFLGRQIAEERNYSEETAKQIDEEVHDIIDRGYRRARELLTARREKLDQIVERLMAEETLEGEEFAKMFGDEQIPAAAAAVAEPTSTPPSAPGDVSAGDEKPRRKEGKGPQTAPSPA
ncbi:MAG: hypothetical protein AUH85_02370 [Chloroflexi bacterium 13_1_40CM_4_68_4]|nr:MAG: hypothetical protein AUH85_02370 [Chloroflexi bacterium 13_1_40CM_4_68_4]